MELLKRQYVKTPLVWKVVHQIPDLTANMSVSYQWSAVIPGHGASMPLTASISRFHSSDHPHLRLSDRMAALLRRKRRTRDICDYEPE